MADERPLPDGPLLDDWRENAYVKGPVSPPTIAAGLVYVSRPDAHEVVALDADSGVIRWRLSSCSWKVPAS